jgi:hypothetical protein
VAPIRRQATATRVISGCPYYLVRLIAGIWLLHIAVECDIQSGQLYRQPGGALTASGEGVGCALIQGISTRIIAKDFKAGLKTAAIAAATVGASYGIGELAKVGSITGAERVGLHMLVGGASSRASGGSFWRGAASSFAANTLPQQMVEMAPQSWHSAMNGAMGHAMLGAIVGGTTAVITGGGTQGFVNGAMTGAMQQLFNHWVHEDAQKKAEAIRKKIAEIALSMEGDERYAYDSKIGRFPNESWKCNKFVSDVLTDAGISAPDNPGGDWPLQANGWANPNHKIPGWVIVDNPMPGDVAAIPRNGTGHVGIYISDRWGSDVMAANKAGVGWSASHLRNDWSHLAAGDTVYRRYVGGN